jgi:AcrR family transcriptional regulator
MPKIVDPEARRREVTEIAAGLLVRGGRSALTVRNVADAAGYSSTVVSHYFTDMLDLLHETYSFAVERSGRRLQHVLERDPTDLAGLVEAVLPLDDERTDDWRIWFAFWSEAMSSEPFAAEQRQRARTHLERLERCLDRLAAEGAISPGVDVGDAAHRLAALVPGIAAEAIFDPQRWPPERQRRVLRSELTLLGLEDRDRSSARS